jgi:DNA-binding Xre family transcriptional regulator
MISFETVGAGNANRQAPSGLGMEGSDSTIHCQTFDKLCERVNCSVASSLPLRDETD